MPDSLSHRNGVFDDRAFTRPSSNQTLSCAVLVVGGSTAAYTAALVTARADLNVCLVQPFPIVGGQFTIQALPVSDDSDLLQHKPDFSGVGGEEFAISRLQRGFRDRLRQLQPVQGTVVRNPGGSWVSPLSTSPVVASIAMNEAIAPFLSNDNLKLIPYAEPVEVLFNQPADGPRRVIGVVFQDTQRQHRFTIQAQITIEATDLGDVLEVGGIESRIGQETRSETGEQALPIRPLPECQQSFTFGAIVEYTTANQAVPVAAPQGYDSAPWLLSKQFEDSFWIRAAGQWEAQPRKVLDTFGIFRYRRLIRMLPDEQTVMPGDVSVVNWGQHQHGDGGPLYCGNDYRLGELVGVSRAERQRHWQQGRDRTQAYIYFLQSRGIPLKLRGDLTWTADGIALMPYIREARRGIALTTIRHEDVAKAFYPNQARSRCFSNSVGIGQYHYLDLHGNDRQGHASLPGDQVIALPFTLPLTALIPTQTDGLILSSKSIGTTHITNAAYRMHPVEWAIGEASGYLAALSIWATVEPRAIATREFLTRKLQGLMTRNGIPIFWFDDVSHNDPDFEAIQVMAAAGIVRSESTTDLKFRPQGFVNRAVVATAMLKLLKLDPLTPVTPTFNDVPPDFWAYGNIEALAAQRLVAGIGDALFAPGQPITRQHLSFLVRQAMPQAYEKTFANTPIDQNLLTRRELSRVLYELLKLKLAAGLNKNLYLI